MGEIEKGNPMDPFRKLVPRAEASVVGATHEQLAELEHKSLVEKFGDFAKKQPALAFRLLSEAEKQPNGEEVLKIALMVYYAVEGQMQTNKTKEAFPDASEE